MSADRWTHPDAGVREIIARETAALTAENEELRARLARVEALADEWATQPSDYDEDTEQQIADGLTLRAALAEGGPR